MMPRYRRRAQWAALAAELGGDHHAPGWLDSGGGYIKNATVRGVLLLLENKLTSSSHDNQEFTCVTGHYRFGPGPEMRVCHQDILRRLQIFFGAQDIELGHREFDAQFMVTAKPPAVVRRLWTDATMTEMLRSFPGGTVRSAAGGVNLILPDADIRRDEIHTMIDFVVELASRDLYGVNALKEVGTLVTTNEWPRAELDTGVRVVVGAEDLDDKLVMSARTLAPLDVATVEIVDGTFSGVDLPQAAHVHAREVGTGTLSRDGFVWRDFELDPARLRAGAELLGAIAASRGGIYR